MILTIVRKEVAPDITVLEMSGRIVLGNNAREVELQVAHLLGEQAKKIIFDLRGVNMLDSTGVGILVVCQGKVTQAGGQLRIAGATGVVDEVLKMTSVQKLVPTFPTVEEAAKGF
jgi:anti-sigma B factor antagonist